jgi:hypothetical protein
MPLPSTHDELRPMTPQISHRLGPICPPSPLQWKAGDGCLSATAHPQPNPSVKAPRTPEQTGLEQFSEIESDLKE